MASYARFNAAQMDARIAQNTLRMGRQSMREEVCSLIRSKIQRSENKEARRALRELLREVIGLSTN